VAIARAGDPGARLLAGPEAAAGAESYGAHTYRLGSLDPLLGRPEALLGDLTASGLVGRGGGAFPLVRKLALAARSPGTPLIVVNASEGEPASRKDQALLTLRPHLVLDGAEVAAALVGADEVIVGGHHHRHVPHRALTRALAERPRGPRRIRIADLDDTYLAGESSALAAFLDGERAIPRAGTAPLAAWGVGGRPTVVSNVETMAHLALIARFGSAWYRQAGTTDAPGSTLVTLAGDVAEPGLVVEVLGPVPVAVLLSWAGGLHAPPRAVLFGGYAGAWVDGARAWAAVLDRHRLAGFGVPLGCGLLAVLGDRRCGLAETARLARWLSDESAGQCGPCARGMPALAAALADLVGRRGSTSTEKRIRELTISITGRGLCHLPDGAALLVESALETFRDELRAHRRAGRCAKGHDWAASSFPLPPTIGR